MPKTVRRDRATAVPGLIPPCTAKPEPSGFSVRFVPRPTHAPGRFCGGGDLAGGALSVSPAHTVPAAHKSSRKSFWSKRDRFIYFFFPAKGKLEKNSPQNSPKRPGTATRKPRRLEAGTWHVVFGLISRETRCVHPPPLSPPLPIPLRLHPHVCSEPFPPSHLPQAAPGCSSPTRHQSLPQPLSHASPTSSTHAPGPSPSDFLPKSHRCQ